MFFVNEIYITYTYSTLKQKRRYFHIVHDQTGKQNKYMHRIYIHIIHCFAECKQKRQMSSQKKQVISPKQA
jgi:hypothetical protein